MTFYELWRQIRMSEMLISFTFLTLFCFFIKGIGIHVLLSKHFTLFNRCKEISSF